MLSSVSNCYINFSEIVTECTTTSLTKHDVKTHSLLSQLNAGNNGWLPPHVRTATDRLELVQAFPGVQSGMARLDYQKERSSVHSTTLPPTPREVEAELPGEELLPPTPREVVAELP